MAKARARRGQVELVSRTHGGKRPGAGRKLKGARTGASHRTRPEHDPRHPVHVTLRVVGCAAARTRRGRVAAVARARRGEPPQ